ncbi:AAA family ATPase [Frondihabitans sp. PhB188]|uniref:AAA family ATPase n=1 Tax=Frondihabitans sp. PhB188 TaxID=2485200 RepID=UPI000F48532A|nr:AAA family ATPase [Frondihabitans sp. PhB188]
MNDALFDSLFRALEAEPDNAELRGQVAELLLERGRHAEALEHASRILRTEPTSATALTVIAGASAALAGTSAPQPAAPSAEPPAAPAAASATAEPTAFDWHRAEADLGPQDVPAPFVSDDADGTDDGRIAIQPGDDAVVPSLDVEIPTVTLADVGGLEVVKQRIRESFLEPMKHPEVAAAFGKTLRGGLLLYGPPGCGKTFMAKAIAGELGARFITVGISDIVGSYQGETERNLHNLFEKARSLAPAVLFLDELDAIGARRSGLGAGWSGLRLMVDQLLLELDSMVADNDGLFVLGATNSPWDVDASLLRPGRFDRMMLVLPPDAPAREAILTHHLERRPIAGIQLQKLVDRTDGFSGADLEHLVASAAEQAMTRSIKSGVIEPIGMKDLETVLKQVKPSTGSWLVSAKNVASFANADGRYDDLVEYLKQKRIL